MVLLLLPAGPDARAALTEPVPDLSRLRGIWIGPEEIARLPTQGQAWDALKSVADKTPAPPNLADQNETTNVVMLAKALVFARTGQESYRQEVIQACLAAIGTQKGGRSLALARNLAAYVIAADLVTLPPEADVTFQAFLSTVLDEVLEERTLRSTQEKRPNNWGTHAAASRIAVALYLRDAQELHQAARVFKGYLGDREAWNDFKFGALDWQADPRHPVGVNPKGAKGPGGENFDGLLPDDQRRCCKQLTWPPPYENYVYEALQGALAAAVMLHRVGYDVWNWQDQALLRAFRWKHDVAGYPPKKDDLWETHVINHSYGTRFPVTTPTRPGKNVGYTDWTHAPAKP
ncbi:MAG: alginate lyase family protein [Magnetococcales bacterium]|nr:alginate lyase family protein [Magnetococcales bacterium]